MTAKEAIEILREEHDYAQLPCYVNQALETAINALEKVEGLKKENEIYKQVNFLIAAQREERDETIKELEDELEKLTGKLSVARIAAYMDFIERLKEKQSSPTHTMDKRIVSFQMIEDTVLELIEEDFPDIEKLVFPTREEAEQTLMGRESK